MEEVILSEHYIRQLLTAMESSLESIECGGIRDPHLVYHINHLRKKIGIVKKKNKPIRIFGNVFPFPSRLIPIKGKLTYIDGEKFIIKTDEECRKK